MTGFVLSPLETGAKVAITYHEDVDSDALEARCDLVTVEVPVGEGLVVAAAITRFLRVEVTS
jgi:hypothetical protein